MEPDNTFRPFVPMAPRTTEYVAYNGLCECRGPYDPHPFHGPPPGHLFIGDPGEYVGRHRPEYVRPKES